LLKLIIDNTKLTCRLHCQLFDEITEKCSIKQEIEMDNPKSLNECEYFLVKEKKHQEPTQLKNINHGLLKFHENWKNQESESFYPFYPDETANREDALWFVSPCKEYGCWVINHSNNRLMAVNPFKNNGKAEKERIYKSPYPLHNHQAPLSLASNMAWYVKGDGYGKYVLLKDGEIVHLSKGR
jgi:hypothetical protein